jgi:hypothetical protein
MGTKIYCLGQLKQAKYPSRGTDSDRFHTGVRTFDTGFSGYETEVSAHRFEEIGSKIGLAVEPARRVRDLHRRGDHRWALAWQIRVEVGAPIMAWAQKELAARGKLMRDGNYSMSTEDMRSFVIDEALAHEPEVDEAEPPPAPPKPKAWQRHPQGPPAFKPGMNRDEQREGGERARAARAAWLLERVRKLDEAKR